MQNTWTNICQLVKLIDIVFIYKQIVIWQNDCVSLTIEWTLDLVVFENVINMTHFNRIKLFETKLFKLQVNGVWIAERLTLRIVQNFKIHFILQTKSDKY